MRRVKVLIKMPTLAKGNLETNPNVKILWSQKMEDHAAEQKRQEAAKLKKQKEHLRLTSLLKDTSDLGFEDLFEPSALLQTSKERLG
jgi:hypothetical protein